MRRAARVDANHAEVVSALKGAGYTVKSLAAVGQGMPDLIVAKSGETVLIEVKDGNKPPSARKLTEPQEKFHREWAGRILTVTSPEDALRQLDLTGKDGLTG
jgi:hypothetical protein